MAIGAITGLAGGIGKMIARGKSNREMRDLQKQDPAYAANPLAAQRLSYATALRDARMPGAASAERNIYGNMGNTLSAVQNNASDSSQVLAMAGAAQGQAQKGFEDLANMEAQNKQQQFKQWEQAVQGQIGEQDKVFGDQLRQYGNKVQMQGAQAENRANTWGDIAGMGFGLADFAGAGGFKGMQGMFGKKPQMQSQMQGSSYGAPNMNVDYGRLNTMLKR